MSHSFIQLLLDNSASFSSSGTRRVKNGR